MKNPASIHPGEVLLEEFLVPLGISQNALARAAGVPPRRINEIVLGKRSVTADTAVRLAAALGTSERFWMGLQADYDLEEARRALGNAIKLAVGMPGLVWTGATMRSQRAWPGFTAVAAAANAVR